MGAGPVQTLLEGTDLRYVHVHGVEVVRRLFTAVRDARWRTIPPEIDALDLRADRDGFSLRFTARYSDNELRFRHDTELTVHADGSIVYRLDGVAESDFEYNRIGICVLHPREAAGRRYRTVSPDGDAHGELPLHIGAQRFDDGKLWPLFPSYDSLAIEADDGFWVRFDFEGDLFEMEDQRNWTDSSFKTYSTPLALGWPHRARRGDRLAQELRITWFGSRVRRKPRVGTRIALGGNMESGLPRLGLGLASHAKPLDSGQIDRLGALGLSHLRADLRLGGEEWRRELARAEHDARQLGCGLELALFLPEDDAELEELSDALAGAGAPIERVLVFAEGEPVASQHAAHRASEHLRTSIGDAALVSGTDGWFADLNRARPDVGSFDGVCYSICATVHADDDRSVCETPAAQGDTVRSARAIYGDLPILVSPVTFRPRSWPFGDVADPRGLPFQVDERQCSLLGSAWTTSSLKHLAEAGVASVTYFETTGWRGVMDAGTRSAERERFSARPGDIYPLYHVLADVGELRLAGAELILTHSTEPLRVEALATRAQGRLHVLVANLTATPQECTIEGLGGRALAVRVLDETTADEAMSAPRAFRARRHEVHEPRHALELELEPYAVLRLDTEAAD